LVAGAARGDQRCWDRLVAKLTPLVRGVARGHRLSPADVDDVAQATWYRLVMHIGTLREPERLPAWLATTARRESLRTLGRGQRQIPHGDDLPEPEPADDGVDAGLLRRERDAALWDAVGRLRPSDQTLLRLLVGDEKAAEERSYRDIADTLGIAVGSIGPTRGRALQRLRAELSDAEALRPAA
jgi:RNA polymerase sigma factor (sigma-70 family)